MTERDYAGFFLWAMAFMIAAGGMILQMWPGLVRFVDRRFIAPPGRPDEHRHDGPPPGR
jgi:hypothetical protein